MLKRLVSVAVYAMLAPTAWVLDLLDPITEDD